jgi:competence protein ComEC
VTGLVEVLRRYKVKKILMTGVSYTAAYYKAFLAEIKKQNIPVEIIKGPEQINLGQNLKMEVLFPLADLEGESVSNLNDTSIVTKLIYLHDSFLFEGDAEKVVEDQLIADKDDLSANVLKVAHHGSSTATSQEFLEVVRPQVAVISVGKNNYGHPAPSTLDRLLQNNVKVLRTDQGGTIAIDSDGEQITIKKSGLGSP